LSASGLDRCLSFLLGKGKGRGKERKEKGNERGDRKGSLPKISYTWSYAILDPTTQLSRLALEKRERGEEEEKEEEIGSKREEAMSTYQMQVR